MQDQGQSSIYDIHCTDLSGNPISLGQFRGHALLIANTASLCGFSKQFKGLEEVWQRYKDQGLVVLGVPSNDFGRQEPGNSAAIISACSDRFGITFPLCAKMKAVGPEAHPLFQWLTKAGGFWGRPRWNFYKYLISPDGNLKEWFSSLAAPETSRFKNAIEKLLNMS